MKQTLKIGQKYRVIKDADNEIEKGTIITVKEFYEKNGFFDENDYYWDFRTDELQLIKPNTKKVKKDDNFSIFRDFLVLFEGLNSEQTLHIMTKCRQLFKATQPQPIKEESKECYKSINSNINSNGGELRKQEDNKECLSNLNTSIGCSICGNPSKNCHYEGCPKLKSTPSPQEESKDIEFEEIEEIKSSEYTKGEGYRLRVFCIVNQLIRNQNLIIKQLKQK